MLLVEIDVPYPQLNAVMLAQMRGRVAHATCTSNIQSIVSRGGILTNSDGSFSSGFGSSRNGFFRTRDCVSVFDLRAVSESQLEESWGKCNPGDLVRRCDGGVALLFLKDEAIKRLEPWSTWKEQEEYSKMVVPFIEAGHPGTVSLSSIDSIVQISTSLPFDPLVEALRAGRSGSR